MCIDDWVMFDEGVFGGHCIDDNELSYQLMEFVELCCGVFKFGVFGVWCECVDEEWMVAFNLAVGQGEKGFGDVGIAVGCLY